MAIKKSSDSVKYDITVNRAKEFASGDIGFDMTVNNISVYGCIYKMSEKGNFISFPAKKSEKDGKYYNHVYFKIDDATLKDIEEKISALL